LAHFTPEKAPETRRAYRPDFKAFTAYCAAHGQPWLPAAPAIVAAFVSRDAGRGISASTITRRIADCRCHLRRSATY
jgi:site-specific recombinase XerD